jgi:hypothetical protein
MVAALIDRLVHHAPRSKARATAEPPRVHFAEPRARRREVQATV